MVLSRLDVKSSNVILGVFENKLLGHLTVSDVGYIQIPDIIFIKIYLHQY